MGRKTKRILAVLLAICTLFTQGNMLAFAAENESSVVQREVDKQTTTGAYASVAVSQNDSYETVLTNAVSAFKQQILAGAQKGDSETSVTFTFETQESYTKMFDYLTSYLWYQTDWEPEMGLLEMALYNESELRPYMEYGSAEHHFVETSTDKDALSFTIYWPILYNQTVENHVAVTRSDGKMEKQEFVVLEDAFDAMDEWNSLYGSDVDYTIEFLDLYSSLIAPDRTEFPEANNIDFIGTEEYEETAENVHMGVQYSLFVASDLKASGNISVSVMNIQTGTMTSVPEGFTWDLGGNTLSNYGFTDVYLNLVNGDLFLSKDDSDFVNEEQDRPFRVFGKVDIGTVRVDKGYLWLSGCYDSKIECLDNVDIVQIQGVEGASLVVGTKKNSNLFVMSKVDLTIGDIIESRYEKATLTVGMPEKGFYPTITGTVTDGNGNSIPLELQFNDNFYTAAYDDTYYHNINLDKDWILLDAPNVEKVNFLLDHTVYDEDLVGRSVAIEGVLSKNTAGQFYLKSPMSWDGMEQTQGLEIGKTYEALIKVYEDNVLIDDSKVTSSFVASYPAHDCFSIEQDGNNYTYSCDEFGFYSSLELNIQIDQEEGVTSWRFPIYAYVQEAVDSITIPQQELTHIEGVGDVYLMVMNGLIYNVAHEGITPEVVSDGEYFLRYESCDENIVEPDYKTGDLFAYKDGLCDIVVWSGDKSATYTVLIGQRTERAAIILKEELVSDYAYWNMNEGEKVQADVYISENSLEDKYGCGVAWESSDESVISIDEDRNVTAVNAGVATLKVTVTCLDGTKKTDEIEIRVEGNVVSEITLNKDSLELITGDSETLTATVVPADAANKAVTWSSSNTSVATVDANGKVTAVGVGTATITATAADGSGVSASCTLTVKPISVSTITLNKTTLELINGNSETLTATVGPSDAANKAVTWSSSNTSVATVDANGKVTAVGVGTAVITATAKDGSGVSASCTVTVKQKYKDGLNEYTDGKLYYFKDNKIDTTYTGVADYKGDTWYVKNGAVDTTVNGLKQVGSVWNLFANGKVNRTTTLASFSGKWWYVENGEINFNYDGVATYGGKIWYIENGQVDFTKKGIHQRGDWYYFKDGYVNTGFTGLTNSSYGWWYIENGKITFNYTGLTQYGGSWWYVKNSQLNFKYDGVADYNNATWYVEDSKVDFKKNGLFQRSGTWYLFKGGKVNYNYNGLTNSSVGWWYIEDGIVTFEYTGLTQYGGSWWYVKNSQLNFKYDGVADYNNATWYVEDSKVDFKKNGLFQRSGTWYLFKGGKVNYDYNGLTNSSVGWWYIEDGIVTFEYTGLTQYGGSWWYVKNSSLNFKYDGVATYGGKLWYVEDSKVDFKKNGLHQRGGTWYLFKGGAVNPIDTIAAFGGSLWYVDDGKVDFNYNGTYEYEGKTYNVVNGKATLVG